ncbi:PhoH family protein [Amphibiibacter pelophylacis]|uniref:PhoH family protein n=1 Tax=Amphibiibacter pelophylacis TaxID=1799477 RepID=A0ACC6NZ38_9BURK
MPLPRAPGKKSDRLNLDQPGNTAVAATPLQATNATQAAVPPAPAQRPTQRPVVAAAPAAAPASAPLEQIETRRPAPAPVVTALTPAPVAASVAPPAPTPAAQTAAPAAAHTASAAPAAADPQVPAPAAEAQRPSGRSRSQRRERGAARDGADGVRSAQSAAPKLFVLDTNVLMHDPMSLFRFEEHDVFLPMMTLEELDGHKKGMSEVARNVRQVSRELDQLVSLQGLDRPLEGIPLAATGHSGAGGRLFFQLGSLPTELPTGLPQGKADNQILGVVQALRRAHPERQVVLVSKDINMRVKAHALGLAAEDYTSDKTLEDGDLLYTGSLALPADFWATHSQNMESWQQGGHTHYRIQGPMCRQMHINQFVHSDDASQPLQARVVAITGPTVQLRTLKDFTSSRNSVWGVHARNAEQNFALNVLLDPECDFITLTGTAGTGKTLLALASALQQVFDDRRYSEIIVTRVTVPLGEDIGFLPGTEEEKMGPWMGALDDNLEFLTRGNAAGDWGRTATQDLLRSKIRIKSLNFMRGRTFLNKFIIVDEAQNLTPKQMKALITRVGPGSKMICMGNIAQIDTPYLTEGSSGLTYVVDRFKGWQHSAHITLARGERSRLADFASTAL